MRCCSTLGLVAFVLVAACGGGERERLGDDQNDGAPMLLIDRLNALDGVTATEIGHFDDGSIVYDLRITQLVDHTETDGATFQQRVVLRFTGRYTGPSVLLTDGYEIQYFDDVNTRIAFTEPTAMFNANQVEVEHRFYGASIPSAPDWSKLTIEQAAADHHHIREVLGSLFTGTWLATGGSKSGMAALYYRYFYPDDVAATVSYVAPFMHSRGDQRFADFLGTVGNAECRAALTAFQRDALDDSPRQGAVPASRRSELLRLYRARYGASNLSLLGDNTAFELAIIFAPFYFWQYSDPALCAEVPNAETPDDVFFDFLDATSGLGGLTDPAIVAARPFRYQSVTQLGTPSVDVDAIDDLLRGEESSAMNAQLPDTAIPAYDPAPLQAVEAWANSTATQVLMIYGAFDPWTAGALTLARPEAKSLVALHTNHHAHVADLEGADLAAADDALERWTGLTIDTRYRSALTLDSPLRRDLQLTP